MILHLLLLLITHLNASSVLISREGYAWSYSISLCDSRYGLAPLHYPIPHEILPSLKKLLYECDVNTAWLASADELASPEDDPFKPLLFLHPGTDEIDLMLHRENSFVEKLVNHRVICIKEPIINDVDGKVKQWIESNFISLQ